MTDAEKRLRAWVNDPEGAYVVLKRGAAERLDEAVRTVLSREPKADTAFAQLSWLHQLWRETQALTDPEQFIEMFTPTGVE